MIQVVAFAFLVVFLCLLFQKNDPGIVFLLLTAGALFLVFFALEKLGELYHQLENFLGKNAAIKGYLGQLLKILGITYLADFGASICKDGGFQTLGKQVELIGKVSILALTVPLLLTVIDTVFGLY